MDLKELINLLPECLQNKIFYYATLHPVAIAFNEIFNKIYSKCTLRACELIQKYRYNYHDEIAQAGRYCICNEQMRSQDMIYYKYVILFRDIVIRRYSVEQILENRRNAIYKRYKRHNRICDECWFIRREEFDKTPIFNQKDEFCFKCVRHIRILHNQIPQLD